MSEPQNPGAEDAAKDGAKPGVEGRVGGEPPAKDGAGVCEEAREGALAKPGGSAKARGAGGLDSGNAGADCGRAGEGTRPLIRMPEPERTLGREAWKPPRPGSLAAWRRPAKCEGFGERENPLESVPPMAVGAR